MQIAPSNPVLQALSGAQETGTLRQQQATVKTETVRAVQAAERGESSQQTQLRQKREVEDDDNTRPKPRGSLLDIVV